MNNTYYGKLIFELSKEGRCGSSLPKNELADYDIKALPGNLMRSEAPALPEVDELTVVRHYTNMSNNN
ncbi:MAG: aminomethyl-transferring glycine dehydrogenase subunit GcvPB, partial [Muribaculaceae bacterium]|nr:aminomethyl-transferring glycine dehydrogenase subunit GcvPB [Muribaculaceae bacterium]